MYKLFFFFGYFSLNPLNDIILCLANIGRDRLCQLEEVFLWMNISISLLLKKSGPFLYIIPYFEGLVRVQIFQDTDWL